MKKLILTVSFLYISTFCLASPVDDLNVALNHFTSLSGHFNQRVISESGEQLQAASGTLAIVRPGKFRWTQVNPTEQIIIVNGQDVTIYDPDLEQATIRSLAQSAGDTPALLLSSDTNSLGEIFSVTTIPSREGENWFQLVPKKEDSVTSLILIRFENDVIDSMEIKDSLGHLTDIDFFDVIINQPIDASQFTFIPPKGVDIFHE